MRRLLCFQAKLIAYFLDLVTSKSENGWRMQVALKAFADQDLFCCWMIEKIYTVSCVGWVIVLEEYGVSRNWNNTRI